MKKYLIFILMSIPFLVLSIGLPFLIWGITIINNAQPAPYQYIMAIFIFIYGLFGYISGDIVILKYRKANESVLNSDVPPEVKEKANKFRMPFIYAMIGTLIAFVVIFIVFLASGNKWPLL